MDEDVDSNATKMICPLFSSFLLSNAHIFDRIVLILCYTFVARIEKVSTLFRYLYVVFWESCLHWFVLQKFAHKGFVSCLSPFGRHGSSKFVLQTSHVWCPGNSAVKDGEFYKYPQNGHFFPITISLFLVIAKQFVFLLPFVGTRK